MLINTNFDPGWVKNLDPDPGVNNPDHISESLKTTFWVKKYLNSLMRILDPGLKKIRIRDGKFGSGINIPDPHHCVSSDLLEELDDGGGGGLLEAGLVAHQLVHGIAQVRGRVAQRVG
jgi:hypothetical protein